MPRRSPAAHPAAPFPARRGAGLQLPRDLAAGAVRRPDVNARVRDISHLSVEMVRVLDDEHRPVGPWNPHLDPPELQVGLRHMLTTRCSTSACSAPSAQGRISFYVRCYGEEAVSVAAAMALRPDDMLFPSYRNQGLHVVGGCRWWT
jgi:2-oxoisovalerate dehydrogenase E1 component alpha subunit